MNNKKIKISLCINLIIFIMVIFASIAMFTGFKFMHGIEPKLESTKIGMFRFFTVDSNVFMGIMALVFVIKEIELLKGELDEIPTKFYILKLMSTTGVVLTFLTVFGYLGPISKGGIPSMLMNSNLFFHLLIPLLSIINFTVFERTNKLVFKHSFCGIIPTLIYAAYYSINVFLHMENGKVSTLYDWYWFVQGGVWQFVIVSPLMLAVTYIISLLLWRFNKKKLDI